MKTIKSLYNEPQYMSIPKLQYMVSRETDFLMFREIHMPVWGSIDLNIEQKIHIVINKEIDKYF